MHIMHISSILNSSCHLKLTAQTDKEENWKSRHLGRLGGGPMICRPAGGLSEPGAAASGGCWEASGSRMAASEGGGGGGTNRTRLCGDVPAAATVLHNQSTLP